MAICKAKCPNCGKIIEIDNSEFNVLCKYCGVPFMPQEGIDEYNNYVITMLNDVAVDSLDVNTDNIDNYVTLGLMSLSQKNHEKCGFYAEDILKNNPNSVEGLLLKAFFLSNNYSKEDGIRYYFSSLENDINNTHKDLIISTFKENMESYSVENFSFLLQTIIESKKMYKELFSYAVGLYISLFDELPTINNKPLDLLTIESVLGSNKQQYQDLMIIDQTLLILKDNELINVIDLNSISKVVEVSKNKTHVSYYFYVNETHLNEVKYDTNNLELEEYLTKSGFTLKAIKGCYIATCVYGDYYSGEVIMLRKYRDYELNKSLLGRLFIKLYYFISPKLVNTFHNHKLFINLNRKILNKLVNKLEKKGYSKDFYRD